MERLPRKDFSALYSPTLSCLAACHASKMCPMMSPTPIQHENYDVHVLCRSGRHLFASLVTKALYSSFGSNRSTRPYSMQVCCSFSFNCSISLKYGLCLTLKGRPHSPRSSDNICEAGIFIFWLTNFAYVDPATTKIDVWKKQKTTSISLVYIP